MPLGLFRTKLKSFAFVLILIKSSMAVYTNISLTEKSEMIRCVSEYINDHTIIFMTSKSNKFGEEFRLKKLINEDVKFYTAIWGFQTVTRNLYSDDNRPFKTLMVVEYDSSNIKELSLISKKINMAAYDWLILTSLPNVKESDFNQIVIPYDCRFIVSSIKENGFWNRGKGLHNVEGEIFSKRMDLRGHTLKFGVHNMSGDFNPCTRHTKIDNGRTMIQCTYFEIWRSLGLALNYTTAYVVNEDCYKNSSAGFSTPMLETIRSGGADTGVDGYVWSSSRLEFIQFLWPLLQSKIILVTKIPSRKFSFSSYVGPFVTSMWFALIGWLLLSGTVFNLIKHISEKAIHKNKLSEQNERVEDIFVPFTAICYQGSTSMPNETTIRIAYLMIYLIPVVFIPSYSGGVISFLSVPSENIPFNDLKEFEKLGTYQLSAVNNTYFQLILMTDDKMESLRQKNLIATVMAPSYGEGFKELCSKKITLMLERPVLTKNTINCNVFILDRSVRKIFSSMAIRKNFPFREIFNRQIQRLVTTGLNMKILQKNALDIFKYEINRFHENDVEIKPFDFDDVLPLFTILSGGILISVVLFAFEWKLGCQKRLEYRWGTCCIRTIKN